MFNRNALLDRLEKMFWLQNDWDGFGTIPITKKVHDIGRQMIEYIDVDVDLKIFVGVEIDGSLFCEALRLPIEQPPALCRVELTVLPEGTIDYLDIKDSIVTSQGSFMLSYEAINDILR